MTLTEAGKKRYGNDRSDRLKKNDIIHKAGEKVSLRECSESALASLLSKINPKMAERQSKFHGFDVLDENGKRIGNVDINFDSKEEMNIVWIGIKAKREGNGYGQSALRTAISYAKKNGVKRITLEVPTNSPNARHIYEKNGFKAHPEKFIGDADDVWGGLTPMTLEIKK